MSNVEKLLIQTFVKSDGERHCLLVNSLTGLPQFFPNLFVTTQIRNASLSLSAMESVLVSISVLLHFCAKNNIELIDRFRDKSYLALHEVEVGDIS